MDDKSKKEKMQFITCPVCAGTGAKDGRFCHNCAGLGLGAFYKGKFLYWGERPDLKIIEIKRFKKRLNRIINFISFFIGLLGLLALSVWVYGNTFKSIESLSFWEQKHILLFIFWLSVIADMFIIYRLSLEKLTLIKIKRDDYEERKKIISLPNNWDELLKDKKKIGVDIKESFEENAISIIEKAYELALKLNNSKVEPGHLIFSCLDDKKVLALFSRLSIDLNLLLPKLRNHLLAIAKKNESIKNKLDFSNNFKEVLIKSYKECYDYGQDRVEAINFILPCLKKDNDLYEIFYDVGIDYDKIQNCITWFNINKKQIENFKRFKKMAAYKPSTNMDRAYTAMATPILNHFSSDLTLASKWGRLEFCVDRQKEIDNILQYLEAGRNGIILVGYPGVGKKSIINGIAELMVKEDVPKILYDKRILKLDIPRLLSGAQPEESQKRLLVILDEIARAGNIVLYIENIETITGIAAGDKGSLDLSEVLANALEKYNIFCLASATIENYAKYIEKNALGQVFAKLEIKEPTINEAIQIVESKVGYFEAKNKIYCTYNAIEEAVKISDKYIHSKFLPQKAIEILESVAVKISKRENNKIITPADVKEVASEILNIPLTEVGENESEKLLNLEAIIHERMVDQEEAVSAVASSLRRARTELREGKRPIASFLFLGPTGVGKTELAKTLADVYFHSEKKMIRLDMSEYQHQDSIKKMIGDAATNIPGLLTEAIRNAPFSLILLDELEKAHPDILNLFLQVMDDGRLTDEQGKTADFTNSIIIATSNAGAVYIQDGVRNGVSIEEIKKVLLNEHLNKILRPELINRFDGIVVFKPLSENDVCNIAKIMINNFGKTLEEKGMKLVFSEEGVKKLAQEGFSPEFGARPMRRLLQDKIENIVANKILAGELDRRDVVYINENAEVEIKKGREL